VLEQVGVRGYRAAQRVHVGDAVVDDIDRHRNRSAGAGDDVPPGNDAGAFRHFRRLAATIPVSKLDQIGTYP